MLKLLKEITPYKLRADYERIVLRLYSDDGLIPFKKKIYEENGELKEIVYMNHKHHHLVDVSGDNKRKTELFNQGEKLKLDISKKQFNILTGEDTDTNCILECPYKDLFKSAIILMPSEIRRRFSEEWEGMEAVVDMVEEVEREEREDMEREENLTREPDTDEESEDEDEDEEEPEEIDNDKYPKHWHTDPFLREHLIEQSRQAEEEMKMEEIRWIAREHSD